MKLQILSDTHSFDYDFHSDADIIVHAGDFCNNLKGCLEFDEACRDEGKTPIFVLGNHDHYGSNIKSIKLFFKDNPQYNCLYPWRSIKVGDYTFVGGTLFTNFRKDSVSKKQFNANKEFAKEYVRDFEAIYRNHKGDVITPEDMIEEYEDTLDYINTFKGKDKTVVVTHFPPSLKCLDPFWGTHPTASGLNPYFINNIDVSGFKLWLSGHTHTAVEAFESGCQLLVNPFGYPNEHYKNGYRDQLLINLDEIYE